MSFDEGNPSCNRVPTPNKIYDRVKSALLSEINILIRSRTRNRGKVFRRRLHTSTVGAKLIGRSRSPFFFLSKKIKNCSTFLLFATPRSTRSLNAKIANKIDANYFTRYNE